MSTVRAQVLQLNQVGALHVKTRASFPLQEANDMMDDTNWSTPLTHDEFKTVLDKHPIGEAITREAVHIVQA